jgi:hypothetical protein
MKTDKIKSKVLADLNGTTRITTLRRITRKMAKKRLDTGPASDIRISSLLGYFKFSLLIETGFAHPKPAIRSRINPIGSMCLIGFNVNLPNLLGVSSPSKRAT